jgi:hypothetical protein
MQSNNCKTSVSNVRFSLSNNETYLSISLQIRRKSIVLLRAKKGGLQISVSFEKFDVPTPIFLLQMPSSLDKGRF